METRQMTPFFSSTFSVTVCDIYYYIWKKSKFIFMRSTLWSILICEKPQVFFLRGELMLWANVKVRDYFHITRKYRGSGHRVCNINVKLNWKIPIVFHNLKNNDSHLIMQELVKFSLKTNVIPNGLVKGFSFNACINDNYLELRQTTLYPLIHLWRFHWRSIHSRRVSRTTLYTLLSRYM